ncbi:MAG: dockerin type I domain-containing protein, partial [Candidatus Zixiibacteriota bacterium]
DSGCVFVTGYSIGDSSGGFSDYATIKYYPNGDTAWVRRYDGPGNTWDEARSLELDLSGNVYVTGYSGNSSWTSFYYATIKYYPNGDTGWVRRYNISQNGWCQDSSMAIDASGNVYVSGFCDGDWITIKYFQSPRGDANRNGVIDVSDIVYLINFIFREGPPPNPLTLGDAGCNGYITIGDIVFLINYLFKSGPAPSR